MENDKNLKIDVTKILTIFDKNLNEVTENDWSALRKFKKKIAMSTTFAHLFSKKAKEQELTK